MMISKWLIKLNRIVIIAILIALVVLSCCINIKKIFRTDYYVLLSGLETMFILFEYMFIMYHNEKHNDSLKYNWLNVLFAISVPFMCLVPVITILF